MKINKQKIINQKSCSYTKHDDDTWTTKLTLYHVKVGSTQENDKISSSGPIYHYYDFSRTFFENNHSTCSFYDKN